MDTVFLALRVALSLAAVLALLWLLQRRLSKRGGKRSAAGSITVVGRQSIGRRANVIMVDVDGTRLLLGVTDQSVSVLHSVELNSADLPQELSTADEFAHSLERVSTPVHAAPAHSAALPSMGTAESEGSPVAMLRPRRDRSVSGKLGGSILSPATWKQTGAALRQSR